MNQQEEINRMNLAGKIVGRNDGRICDHTNFEQFQENKKKTLEHYSINKYYIEQYILTQNNDDL